MSSTMSGLLSPTPRKIAALLLAAMVVLSAPAQCQDGAEWDRARAALMAEQPGAMAEAIARWQALTQAATANPGLYGFDDYAGFVLAYPGFPDEIKLRLAAERALTLATVSPARLVALFDREPPLTNPARAQYALALAELGRPEAADTARAAWRGGTMADTDAAAILARYGAGFTQADHDARLDALLWDGNTAQAAAQLPRAAPPAQSIALARLALQQGRDPEAPPAATPAAPTPPAADPQLLRADPGYIHDRARYLLRRGDSAAAAELLANRPAPARPALDLRKWVNLALTAARDAGPAAAAASAERARDALPPGTDISRLAFPIRDDYTSLMWLGGSTALNTLGDPARAAAIFYQYGTAARTPQTRAKGFYWAGRALQRAGQADMASRYLQFAASYPDQYYGMLALERLGEPLPPLADPPHPQPTADQRAAFLAQPLTRAVHEVARGGDWATTIRFFREISARAQGETGAVLVAELARNLGRRDLGVILGQAAANEGYGSFRDVSFPLIPVPADASWTMVHAITRQESQFSQNALSHAGARGLMQLMPATAAEQARKLGLAYEPSMLTSDPATNIRLGDALFSRLMTTYNGSYPLAIAAYNAGPGNVNRWLATNGDPRGGTIDWVDWVERIPLTETRGYVQHVIENAVVYEALHPARATYRGPDPVSHFLGKQRPG